MNPQLIQINKFINKQDEDDEDDEEDEEERVRN